VRGQITAQGLNNLALLHNGAGCGVPYQCERDRLALHQCAHRSPGFRWKPLVPEAQSCQGTRVERLQLKRPIAGDVADHPVRERLSDYMCGEFNASPLPDRAALLAQLRYAAGVEIAAMQEYLTAAWSLRPAEDQPEPLLGDLKAAFHALLRIAIGEMRHVRLVNDVLSGLSTPGSFTPALAVAAEVPGTKVGTVGPVLLRAATQAAIDDFIGLEAPSQSGRPEGPVERAWWPAVEAAAYIISRALRSNGKSGALECTAKRRGPK
jgi:Ferritin-like